MTATDTPAARSTDPCTSHDAAEQHTASGNRAWQREMVRRALVVHGQGGMTADELAEASGIDYYAICRRLPELRTRNQAFVRGGTQSPEKRKNPHTGRSAMVWRPMENKQCR